MPHQSRARAAFTLIELLVVVAIIALLMAMLLPVLKNALEISRVTVCATNLKSVHTSVHALALDRQNGMLPPHDWGQTVVGMLPPPNGYISHRNGVSSEELIGYGYDRGVVDCPGVLPDTGGDRRWTFWFAFNTRGYNGTDYLYTGGTKNDSGGKYISLDRIVDSRGNAVTPHNVIYIGDLTYNNSKSYPATYYGDGHVDPSNHRDDRTTSKHGLSIWPALGRGSNRLKADGTVEWYNFPQKYRMRGGRMGGAYHGDYYSTYW